jgi:hypothetical protein
VRARPGSPRPGKAREGPRRATIEKAGMLAMQHGLLPEEEFPGGVASLSRQPPCIAFRFFIMTASVLRSSSAGLKITTSVPGSCFTGMWPGGV